MMKKQILWIFLLLGLTLAACEDNKEQYLDEYSTITYFRNSGVERITLYKTGIDADYNVIVNKAGSNLQTATTANVEVMKELEINYYNQRNATNYLPLPTDCYLIKGETALNFAAGETGKKIEVVFKTNTIDQLMAAHPNQEYVLPLQLVESADSINANKKTLLIQPQVLTPTVFFEKIGMEENMYDGSGTDILTYSQSIGMSLKNQWAFDCKIAVDEEALTAYNKENGTNFELLGEEAYEMPELLSFTPGVNLLPFEVKVDYSKLVCGAYALPLKLSEPSNANFVANEHPFILGIIYKAPKIALTTDMLYCNYPMSGSEGNLANLLDGSIKTYFHSLYGSTTPNAHYLQVNLSEPVRSFQYSFTTRDSSGNGNPIGTVVQVSADGVNFVEVAHITQGLPTAAATAYLSPILKAGQAIKHIRLINDGALNGRQYFVFSEFALFGK